MAERRQHALHQGELFLQRRMNSPAELVENLPRYIDASMPQQHADFYAGLSYLAVATMDKNGRPWATLLVTKSQNDPSIGINVAGHDELDILSLNGPYDPFIRALEEQKQLPSEDASLFAGVGVDFSNRRRNKLAGTVSHFDRRSDGQLHLALKSDQHLGNCPKYITVRSLEPFPRIAQVALDAFESFNGSLPEPCKELIASSSTVYLATRHIPDSAISMPAERDMGLNHRGGAPGFVRVYEETGQKTTARDELSDNATTTYVVLPDHSGNRFYQSLGNIHSDRFVGLTFPDFTNGDMLYLTGIAENLFDEEAEALMLRVGLLTRVRLTGAVYVRGAMQLRMTSEEEYSPYNPPVRYLRSESPNLAHIQASLTPTQQRIRAKLTSKQPLSESVTKFTFALSTPVAATLPGGFGIFDFSEHFDSTYRHMDEINPQSLNDDYVRTWTISSAAGFNANENSLEQVQQIDITVKRKDGGAVSGFLHDQGSLFNSNRGESLSVDFVGNGGAFSCFSQAAPGELPVVPAQMLWIAGGVGITPFMSMWNGILSLDKALAKNGKTLFADMVLVFAGRDDDLNLLKHFLAHSDTHSNRVRMRILGFQSLIEKDNRGNATRDALVKEFANASLLIEQKRVDANSLARIENLSEREAFLCGPEGFMRHIQTLLDSLSGADMVVHTESYSF